MPRTVSEEHRHLKQALRNSMGSHGVDSTRAGEPAASTMASEAIVAEMRHLEAHDREMETELRQTLSQIERLQRGQPCEPEPEPEPAQAAVAARDADDGPELARTLTQEVFSRLVEHPNLSEEERARVRALGVARRERMEDREEDEDDDGAGTGLFTQSRPSKPARSWSQERLDAASTELEALREIQGVRGTSRQGEVKIPLQRVDSQVAQASELERVWMEVAALREQLGLG